jgi:hypothetical protein
LAPEGADDLCPHHLDRGRRTWGRRRKGGEGGQDITNMTKHDGRMCRW